MEAPHQKRGMANPRIVDLINANKENNEVILIMMEDRKWGSVPNQLKQVEDKFNTYLGFVLDGFLVQHYPQYDGYRACFKIQCIEAIRDEDEEFFNAVKKYAESQNIRFEIEVMGNGFQILDVVE
jgi:hypothetical protein